MKGDDLFEKSAMTFGEHLEELRITVARASIWLGLGLLCGLPLATYVVDSMQMPLKESLKKFYRDRSMAEMKQSYGKSIPADLETWMIENQVASETCFLDQRRLAKVAELDVEDYLNADSEGVPEPNNLISMRLWRKIEANAEAMGLQEPFMIWLKAGFVVAIILASPGIFFHIWHFVSAGLYPHERRYVYFFLPVSIFLFWAGAFLAFFVIFRYVIDFLLTFNASMGIGASPRLNDYMSFALFLPLGFGIAFQLPIAMLILERIGILSISLYIKQWRYAVLAIAFLSMVLTPAEPMSMIGMAIPLIGLYFLGIAMCYFLPRASMTQR